MLLGQPHFWLSCCWFSMSTWFHEHTRVFSSAYIHTVHSQQQHVDLGQATQAPSPAAHKYGAAAQQAYTLVTTPMATAPPTKAFPVSPTAPLALVLQLVGHNQLDDISGVSMHSTAYSVYLKCQPTTLPGMPEFMLALCRPPLVLAPPPASQVSEDVYVVCTRCLIVYGCTYAAAGSLSHGFYLHVCA